MKLLVGETSGATGENVDCGGHIRADFNDLRFTNSNGDLLNYWIESITGTTPNRLATVWVKFDSIGTPDTTFYMYYGKADAAAYSNGANTFIAFDNFERGSNGDAIGGSWNTPGLSKISTDHAYSATRSGKIPYNNTNPYISGACAETKAVRFRLWKESASTNAFIMWGLTGWNCRFFADSNQDIYYADSSNHDTGYNITPDAWGLWEIFDVNLTNHTYSVKYNGTQIMTNVPMQNVSFGAFGFYNPDTVDGHDFYIDDVIIRNYRSTEPVWGTWGAEQAN